MLVLLVNSSLRNGIKMSLEKAVEFFNKGNLAYSAGDFDSAAKLYTQAIEEHSDFVEAYQNRGNAKEEIGDMEGALNDYKKVIEIDKNHLGGHLNLAASLSNTRQLRVAREIYQKVINKIAPDCSEAYNGLGNISADEGNFQDALRHYDKSIRLAEITNPNLFSIYVNRGTVKDSLGDYAGAIADYSHALKLKPDDHEAYYNRASTKIKLRAFQAAISDLNCTLKYHPKHILAYVNRGNAKREIGDLIGSEQDYLNALEIDPHNLSALGNLGTLNFQLGRTKIITEGVQKSFEGWAINRNQNTIKSENIFYCFRGLSSFSIDELVNSYLYLANPRTFNDFQDCPILDKYGELSLENHIRVKCFINGNDLDSETGTPLEILNELMWGHYGDAHKGFAVGYRFNEKFWDSKTTTILPVNYTDILRYNDNGYVYYCPQTVNEYKPKHPSWWDTGLLTKKNNWAYENEYRLIKFCEDARGSGGIRFNLSDLITIDSITFGVRATLNTKQTILDIFKNRPTINFFEVLKINAGDGQKLYRTPLSF